MYTKQIPFKDFKGKPRNQTVHFNLTETEVFKLLAELQRVFKWIDSQKEGEQRELSTDEVVEFYTSYENIMLEAFGEPSEDGLHFRKGGRYDFQESALFNAAMLMFITNPEETVKLLEGILPDGMEELAKKADERLVEAGKNATTDEAQAEIARLRAELSAARTSDAGS